MMPRTQTLPLDDSEASRVWRDAPISNVGEVLELARAWFGPVEGPVTPPPLPGCDPMVERGTDKGRFFREDWRNAAPADWTLHRLDGAAPKGLPGASSVSLTNNERSY